MRSLVLASILVAATPAVALAHITLTSPAPRSAPALQKDPPCGAAGSVRSANPTVFAPGQQITVTWDETIDHSGHYRISLDLDGESFTIPLSFTDTTQTENVLVDNITDRPGGGLYSQAITLPTTPCENCTIQLIQMMTESATYEPENDIYFTCADIAIREGGVPGPDAGDGGNPANPDGGIDDPDDSPATATGGCSTSAAGSRTGILTLLLAVILVPRRRRRSS